MTRAILTMIALASLSSCGGKEREKEVRQRVGERMRTELAGMGLELGSPVFIRAFKEEKELELFFRGKETGKFALFRKYSIAATSGELGRSSRRATARCPRGFTSSRPRR